jgi:hypothetical protein
MVIVRLFTGQLHARKGEVITIFGCTVLTALWLVLHSHFTTRPDRAYDLVLGSNLVRNSLAFAAWMSGVPREALRMAATGSELRAMAWIAITALPMLAAFAMAFGHDRSRMRSRQWLSIALFAVMSYGPYFPLAWNSYAYYAAIAAVLPAVALAHCTVDNPRMPIVLLLVALSSWAAVEGTRQLDDPGLIGRARWAEAMLRDLELQNVDRPLWVEVRDTHRFYAVGTDGLAWRLNLPVSDIHVVAQCPASTTQCLRIGEGGDWQLGATTRLGARRGPL